MSSPYHSAFRFCICRLESVERHVEWGRALGVDPRAVDHEVSLLANLAKPAQVIAHVLPQETVSSLSGS